MLGRHSSGAWLAVLRTRQRRVLANAMTLTVSRSTVSLPLLRTALALALPVTVRTVPLALSWSTLTLVRSRCALAWWPRVRLDAGVVAVEAVENARRVAIDVALVRRLRVHIATIVIGFERTRLRSHGAAGATAVTRALAARFSPRLWFRR